MTPCRFIVTLILLSIISDTWLLLATKLHILLHMAMDSAQLLTTFNYCIPRDADSQAGRRRCCSMCRRSGATAERHRRACMHVCVCMRVCTCACACVDGLRCPPMERHPPGLLVYTGFTVFMAGLTLLARTHARIFLALVLFFINVCRGLCRGLCHGLCRWLCR